MSQFLQSKNDFPLMVNLGGKVPSWGLSRWNGNHGLRFIPPDDEGFALRGDKRRLVYKGRKRSHRFTILGDTAFEYDCILEREPDSNVIALRIEGAEYFDFFRQPDFVKDPFIAGSYAVYKKETLLGEGTGKLYHIHRPLIIDAQGRRVFGDLAVVGNELRITVPEGWLAEAAYPVIVDPTVGTTTVGKLNFWPDDEDEGVYLEDTIAVNRFLASQTFSGQCTAFAYVYEYNYCDGGYGVIYSDNANKPSDRRSYDEEWFELEASYRWTGWKSGIFETAQIQSGSYIWFGIAAEPLWCPLYDYGSTCHLVECGSYYSPPNKFPTADKILDMKLSMYFEYSNAQNYVRTLTQSVKLTDSRKTPLDFLRTAQQTVQGTDTVTRLETFIRQCVDTVSNSMIFNRSHGFYRTVFEQIDISGGFTNSRELSRKFGETLNGADHLTNSREIVKICTDNVSVNSFIQRIQYLIKSIHEMLIGNDVLANSRELLRNCTDDVIAESMSKRYHDLVNEIKETASGVDTLTNSRELFRNFGEMVHANSVFHRVQRLIKTMQETLTGNDAIYFPVVFVRSVTEKPGIFAVLLSWRVYYRFLFDVAGNAAKADRNGEFIRLHDESVQVKDNVFRSLFIVVRLVATSIVRDLFFSRFLNARKEIVLKSCITLDITLESRIGRM